MWTTSSSLLARLRVSFDQEAWERFVDMYTPLLLSWTKRLGLDHHQAADLVQDVFTVLVEQLPQFVYDRKRSFRAWLKTILLNRYRNWLRQRAAENRQAAPLQDVAAQADATPDLEEAEYRHYLVARALALMQAEFQPATWKACCELVMGGRRADDIARELGISTNAVYLAKCRVLRRLREELAGLLD